MSNQKDRDGASTGHASRAPSGEPWTRSRSASIVSTTNENPHQSTLKLKSTKSTQLNPYMAHTAAGSIPDSRPGSRASLAPSVGRSASSNTANRARSSPGRLQGEEGPELGGIGNEEGGDSTFVEANTGVTRITVSTETPDTEPRTMNHILASFGLQPKGGMQSNLTALAPSAQIVPGTVKATAPVVKRREIEKNKDKDPEPSPGAEARLTLKRREELSQERGVGHGPSTLLENHLIPPIKGPLPEITRIRERKESEHNSQGNHSETKGGTHPRLHLDRMEQTRADFALLNAILNDKARHEALLIYHTALEQNGGQEDPNLFKNYQTSTEIKENRKSREKEKERETKPVATPKRVKAHPSFGLRMQDLEGGRKNAHTPTLTPSNDRNCGIPPGGYLHDRLTTPAKAVTTTGGNPSDSSDSNKSSSSDSEDDYRNMNPRELAKYVKKLKKKKKEKEKLRKLQLSGFKTKLPTTYDGSSDFDRYEQFVYEVQIWVEDTGFKDYEAVKHMKGFLEGKAAVFYMSHVAPEVTKYTLTLVFQELFDYCFPSDIQAQIRREFNDMTQAEHGFRDFYRELRKIQRRLTDINDKALAVRMWEGAHSYLRVEWARNGYSAEHNTPKELEESAIRYENAEIIRRTEEDHWSDERSTSESDRFEPNEEDEPRSERLVHENRHSEKEKVPRLSPGKFAEYRAEGRCVFCHQIGHIARNCPERTLVKPEGLSSSRVSFACIHKLESASDASYEVYSLSFQPTSLYALKASSTAPKNPLITPDTKTLRAPPNKHINNLINHTTYKDTNELYKRRKDCSVEGGQGAVIKKQKLVNARERLGSRRWKRNTPKMAIVEDGTVLKSPKSPPAEARPVLAKGMPQMLQVKLANAAITKQREELLKPIPMYTKDQTYLVPKRTMVLEQNSLAKTKTETSSPKPIEPPIGKGECKDRVTSGHGSEVPEP